jgi:hypothetical protein
MSFTAQLIVVIGGQTPPPTGWQNVMIVRLLDNFRSDILWSTENLEFRFAPFFFSGLGDQPRKKFGSYWEFTGPLSFISFQ